jgi:hypothetical protein
LRDRLPLPDVEREREPLLLRDEDDDALPPFRDDDELLRLRVDDEPLPLRDEDERDDADPLPLRDDDELLRLRDEDDARRRVPVLRSAAGISSCATAFVSCGISFSRNFAIRSSSRLMPRAIFAVSLSPTRSASVSIAV